jgi:ABC-type lipoprotein release transport system permease subunit
MEFKDNIDNLSMILDNPNTHPAVKKNLEKLRKISWKNYKKYTNRMMQLVSYTHQMLSKVFNLMKGKKGKETSLKLTTFIQNYNQTR